jgi:hypothetical protein
MKIICFNHIIFLFKHRLQLEDQLRQQLDNQRRVEEMHALESKSNYSSKNQQQQSFQFI